MSGVLETLQVISLGISVIKGLQELVAGYTVPRKIEAFSGRLEKLERNIFYHPQQEVWDTSVSVQRTVENLQQLRQAVHPVQDAIGANVVISKPIISPDKFRAAITTSPENILFDIQPLRGTGIPENYTNDPTMVPVVFSKWGQYFVGLIKVGYAKDYLNCEYRPQYSLAASSHTASRPSGIVTPQTIKLTRAQVQEALSNASSGLDLSNQDLSGVNLASLDLRSSKLCHVNLTGANLSGAHLAGGFKPNADLTGADLSNAQLVGARLKGLCLINNSLRGANLSGADLSSADLRGADLRETNLSSASLRGAKFHASWTLWFGNVEAANLEGADLRGANLRGWANLQKANLTRVNAQKADFQGADMRRCVLDRAQLHETNLINVDLRDASLRGVSLRSALLQGANLGGANLQQADLTGAKLSGAKYNHGTEWPQGFSPLVAGVILEN